MTQDWFKDVDKDWVPYLETLYKDGKTVVPNNEMANNIKDAVHHYSHATASIEYFDNKFHVVFVGIEHLKENQSNE